MVMVMEDEDGESESVHVICMNCLQIIKAYQNFRMGDEVFAFSTTKSALIN